MIEHKSGKGFQSVTFMTQFCEVSLKVARCADDTLSFFSGKAGDSHLTRQTDRRTDVGGGTPDRLPQACWPIAAVHVSLEASGGRETASHPSDCGNYLLAFSKCPPVSAQALSSAPVGSALYSAENL